MLKNVYEFTKTRKLLILSVIIFTILNMLVFPDVDERLIPILSNSALLMFISYLIVFGKSANHKDVLKNTLLLGAPILAISFSLLYFFKPLTADWLAYEDFIIEYATAIFALIGSFVMIGVSTTLFSRKNIKVAIPVLILALGFFIVAMEEISWGQRIFGIESNEYFVKNNMQGEINLHNLNTNVMMIAFTLLTFMYFVILPYFKKQTGALLEFIRLPSLKILIPSLWVIPVYAVAFGFSTGVSTSGIALLAFITMVLMYLIFSSSQKTGVSRLSAITSLVALFFTLSVMILIDLEGVGARIHSPSEYREFFMCLAILAYSIDVAFRLIPKSKVFQRK